MRLESTKRKRWHDKDMERKVEAMKELAGTQEDEWRGIEFDEDR